MPSLHITTFSSLNTEISARNKRPDMAQIAHNCLLWDGSLRPMAKWVLQNVQVSVGDRSLIVVRTLDPNTLQYQEYMKTDQFIDVIQLDTRKRPTETVIGLDPQWSAGQAANIKFKNTHTNREYRPVGINMPIVSASTVQYSANFSSKKPVSRLYAISAMGVGREGESQLVVLPDQDSKAVIYEGDLATINVTVATNDSNYPAELWGTGQYAEYKLYRTITGLDAGQAAINEMDTEWHLVAVLSSTTGLNYVDDGVASKAYDTYVYRSLLQPVRLKYDYLSITGSHWIVAASMFGDIQISERDLFRAYPVENFYKLPDTKIMDMVAHHDDVYFGTDSKPFVARLTDAQNSPLTVDIDYFSADYPCIPYTMDETSTGAIYASSAGVVGLSNQAMKLLTSGIGTGFLPLYTIKNKVTLDDVNGDPVSVGNYCASLRFSDTKYGAYYNGKYFGFCEAKLFNGFAQDDGPVFSPAPPPSTDPTYKTAYVGYLYDTGSQLDGEHPNQRLVTFDYPDKVTDHVITANGLSILTTTAVYTMPFPDTESGGDYFSAPKLCYTWKSKKFVYPGLMTFSAAKVVHDCNGFVRLKLYVNCKCVYTVKVTDCKPFRLPPNMVGVEWEIELEGTATVHEVHLASSMKELLET